MTSRILKCPKCGIEIRLQGINVSVGAGVPNWAQTCKEPAAVKIGVPMNCPHVSDALIALSNFN